MFLILDLYIRLILLWGEPKCGFRPACVKQQICDLSSVFQVLVAQDCWELRKPPPAFYYKQLVWCSFKYLRNYPPTPYPNRINESIFQKKKLYFKWWSHFRECYPAMHWWLVWDTVENTVVPIRLVTALSSYVTGMVLLWKQQNDWYEILF